MQSHDTIFKVTFIKQLLRMKCKYLENISIYIYLESLGSFYDRSYEVVTYIKTTNYRALNRMHFKISLNATAESFEKVHWGSDDKHNLTVFLIGHVYHNLLTHSLAKRKLTRK